MRLTGPLTRRRREAIALAAREQISAATARMQRNVYRDHLNRLADAVDAINYANAYAPSLREARLAETIGKATALVQMARDYDTLQTTTDSTIQGN